MTQIVRIASAIALTVVLVATATSSAADDPSIKEIMTKAHKGADSLKSKLEKELKGKEVAWADVQKEAKELNTLGEQLVKAKPSKGEMTSWEKLAKAYSADAKALSEAADKKEQKDAVAALKKINASCGACHKAHKG